MISYDITDNSTRNNLSKFLKDYGQRVQKSVFECDIDSSQYYLLKQEIKKLINGRKDRVRFYRFCDGCRSKVEISGWGEVTEDENFYLI